MAEIKPSFLSDMTSPFNDDIHNLVCQIAKKCWLEEENREINGDAETGNETEADGDISDETA